jgi:alpha-galactosidase
MITKTDRLFTLSTKRTSYLFAITETGHLEHLYYGRRLNNPYVSLDAFAEKRSLPVGGAVAYDSDHPTLFLTNLATEYSTTGKGEYREAMVEVEYGRGMKTLDFIYQSARILSGKPRMFGGLPQSYGTKEQCSTLEIMLKDRVLPIRLALTYTVFTESDVITRRATLYNDSSQTIRINNIASLQLDLNGEWDLTTFDGSWARERYMHTRPLRPGIHVNDSKSGVSSADHNPCIFLSNDRGESIGVNLIYSGDHRELVEVSPYGKTRVLTGINPATFSWYLSAQDRFQSPEAILTFSASGMDGASRNFHHFVNNHITRGAWKFRERPVLVNSWEAAYFKFTEDKLLSLARESAELGVELFVLDDGWFGLRNDDTSSLGDWSVNTKKLPGGLAGFSREIHRLGMMFGLWVEPEMVSIESQLYKKHPDWVIAIPDRQPSVGRNQYILDLTRQDVRDHLLKTLTDLFHLGDVNYVKWDMNRTFTDLYSSNGEIRHHGEFLHRYVLGLYELLEKLTQAFPKILFEGCASGGNRFDLGMLCYVSQMWTSDNTDALSRMYIQEGTSCGYPLSVMGSHVSTSPNHQTLRRSDLESRFNVAAFGLLGYELDITALNRQQKEAIRSQISFYKNHRSLLQYGTFIRVKLANSTSNQVVWAVANSDRSELLVLFAQKLAEANPPSDILRIEDVDTQAIYEVFPRQQKIDLKMFGDLINRVSPVPITEGGIAQETISKTISLDSEVEHYRASGEQIAYGGIKLNAQFGGLGYDSMTRVMADFGSRIYLFKRVDSKR